MKRSITLACLVMILLSPCFGQQFSYISNAPFGMEVIHSDQTRRAQSIFFYDYDGDNDLDLFVTGLDYFDDVDPFKWVNLHFFIEMQVNTGDKTHPAFGPRQDIQNFTYPVGYLFVDGADLNGDGNMDFITSADIDFIGNQKVTMLINSGLPGPNQYHNTTMDAFGLEDFVAESMFVPNLVDLDGDGDLDLMMSGFKSAFGEEDGADVPVFYYARNAGDIHTPNFQGWYNNPYDLVPDTNSELLTSGDIDNDGDIDLIGSLLNKPSDSINYLTVHLNETGPNGHPRFANVLISPFGMPTVNGDQILLLPELADIDGDGDLDLFVFEGSGQDQTIQYYENNLCGPPAISQSEITLCGGEQIEIEGQVINSPGIYMINTTSVSGCDSIITLTVNVDIVDPSVSIVNQTLMAVQSGATYQWFNCDTGLDIPGAVDQTYVVTATGNYAVDVTNNSGCLVQSMCVNVVISGIADILAGQFSMYPNPSSGFVYLKNDTGFSIDHLIILNLSGQDVGQYKAEEKSGFDLSSLEAGVYFIKTTVNGYEIMKKLVIL